jgi:hypothetical protein
LYGIKARRVRPPDIGPVFVVVERHSQGPMDRDGKTVRHV